MPGASCERPWLALLSSSFASEPGGAVSSCFGGKQALLGQNCLPEGTVVFCIMSGRHLKRHVHVLVSKSLKNRSLSSLPLHKLAAYPTATMWPAELA